MENKESINSALSSFLREVSSGEAIRHLASKDLSVNEIKEQLTFPAPDAVIREEVWKYYLDEGIICLKEPESTLKKYSYVEDYDLLGRKSFRRIELKEDVSDRKYVKVNFGRRLYNDRDAFLDDISELSASDRDYILGLPWPLTDVWHMENDRILRILEKYNF